MEDYNKKYDGYVMIDEAGRGCVGGELVFTGVKIKDGSNVDFADDSKKLTFKQRDDLVQRIKENVDYHTVIVTAAEIDQIGLSEAIKESLELLIAHFGKDSKFLYDGKAKFGVENPNLETLVKADALVKGVGAASIIAKHKKDELMQEHHKEFPLYGWNTNAGYITKKHVQAIIEHGYTPYHRKSYKIKELEEKEIKDTTSILF